MSQLLLKISKGAASLTVGDVHPHAWRRSMRISFSLEGAKRSDEPETVTYTLTSPAAASSFAAQIEQFIADPDRDELRVLDCGHGRLVGHFVRGRCFGHDDGVIQVLDCDSWIGSYERESSRERLLVPEAFLGSLCETLQELESRQS